MKNKSKLKKIKERNTQGKSNCPKEWLYLNEKELTVEELGNALKEMKEQERFAELNVEVWDVAGVLEVEIPEQKSIDFEEIELDLGTEEGNAFLGKNNAKSLFCVTIDPENYTFVKLLMEKVVEKMGGLFCGDTKEFAPVVK